MKRILQAGARYVLKSRGAGQRPSAPCGRLAMSVPKATGSWFSSSWMTANVAAFRSLESTSEYQMKQTIKPVPGVNVFHR